MTINDQRTEVIFAQMVIYDLFEGPLVFTIKRRLLKLHSDGCFLNSGPGAEEVAETSLSVIKKLQEQLEAEKAYLQEELKLENNHEKIIGRSGAIKNVLYKVGQIAASNTTVLILGETGTGKELVARAIHGLSLRKKQTMIKVNCAALPANLIESELFGATRHFSRQFRRSGPATNSTTAYAVGELWCYSQY